jgi:hypothetical protein
MAQELIRMTPALVNGISQSEIFPMASADTAILRGITRMISPEQIKLVSGLAAQAGPDAQAAFAVFMNRLQELQKQDQTDAAKLKELQAQGLGGDPEFDAQGTKCSTNPHTPNRNSLQKVA